MSVHDFLETLKPMPRFPSREEAILEAAFRGEMVPLVMADVPITANGKTCVFRVATDVFSLGTPDDFVRVPLSPLAAQVLADRYHLSLVTKRISDATWRQAKLTGAVLEPQPMTPPLYPYDASMMTVERFIAHNTWVEKARAGRLGLLAGHKKDVVLTNLLETRPTQVGIYGWHHQATGVAIQPLSLVHESTYADYSHGIRFMDLAATVDGVLLEIEQIAADHPEFLMDVSATGDGSPSPLRVFRQPGQFPLGTDVRPPGDTEPAPGQSISEAALREALVDLDRGIHEVPPGSNSGPVIDDYLRAAGVGPHNEWCAAAVTAWLKRGAERAGKALPIVGSAGALELGRQLQTAPGGVTWIPAAHATIGDLATGAVVVWRRPEAGPGKGHVGLVHSRGAEHFFVICGNEGDWVRMSERSLADPDLVGVGALA